MAVQSKSIFQPHAYSDPDGIRAPSLRRTVFTPRWGLSPTSCRAILAFIVLAQSLPGIGLAQTDAAREEIYEALARSDYIVTRTETDEGDIRITTRLSIPSPDKGDDRLITVDNSWNAAVARQTVAAFIKSWPQIAAETAAMQGEDAAELTSAWEGTDALVMLGSIEINPEERFRAQYQITFDEDPSNSWSGIWFVYTDDTFKVIDAWKLTP